MLLQITPNHTGAAFSVAKGLTNVLREKTQVKGVSKADIEVKTLISDEKRKPGWSMEMFFSLYL